MGYIISEVLSKAKVRLKDHGFAESRDAEFLLEEVLGRKVLCFDNSEITNEQNEKFEAFLSRRLIHEPMDSIIGYTEFMGLKIPFSKYALTPRQETEIMVDRIVSDNAGRKNLKIMDLCSGSGCIGISLAKHLGADVTLVDISTEALKVSEQNARLNHIKVKTICSDLFENVEGVFDIIVSNPPYIPTKDLRDLELEVKDYDPILALDGGEDGLDFYRKIVEKLKYYLNDYGLIYMEFGVFQSEEIVKLLTPDFDNIEVVKDYSGIDRYIKARKKIYVK
jgi:release factor glutamine methyltransferase